MVVDGVCLTFVEGEEDQSTVVVEISVVEQWEEPVIEPLARKVNVSIMAIVDHIWRDEHPLREGRGIDIGGEVVEVAMKRKPGGNRGNRIVEDGWVVFAYVEGIRRCRGVEVIDGREAILFSMSKRSSA